MRLGGAEHSEMNIPACPGVAVREFPMNTGEADYLLYAGGKVLGVVEAKPQGHTMAGVESQSIRYAGDLSPCVPAHRLPLPLCYESTGAATQLTSPLKPDSRNRKVAFSALRQDS
jgi:type I restriction enzyme R subunit